MANGIGTAIRINDQMSPALKSMNKALMIVLNTFESMQAATNDPINTAAIAEARSELARVNVTLDQVENNARQAANAQEEMTNAVKNTDSAMNGLVRKVGTLIATYASFQSLLGSVKLSDTLTQIDSRLNLVVDDKGSVEALEAEIMASANRSRASYIDTADAVSKLALRAGDAFTDASGKIDTNQIIGFTENLNKLYAIAGASAEEQASSMLQLTQALGSGVLRGEEFNAVFEAAPNIMQEVADYMGVPIGELRNLAAEGQISADVVKNAILSATESINADFESMDMTWAQVMTLAKNRALQAFEPVLDKINELANNEAVQNFANGIADSVTYISMLILWAFEQLAGFGQFVYDNWSWISPIIYGVAAALAVYGAAIMLVKAYEMAAAAAKIAMAIGTAIATAAQWMFAAATTGATAAQWSLNGALYACPLTWIIALIIAIISVILILIGWILKVAGVSDSVIGGIMGSLNVAVAFIWNNFLSLMDLILGIISLLWNRFATFANFFGNVFNDPVASIIHLFGDMADTILGILESIASAIDKVFGSNLADAVSGWRGSLDTKINTLASEKGNGTYEEVMENVNLSTESFGWERKEYGASFKAGEQFGNGIADTISNFSMDSIMDGINVPGAGSTGSMPGIGSYGDIPSYDELAGNVGDIKEDTGSIKDAVEVSEEDLKYLRDIAEQEAINRFTTAEISIDMGGVNNNINSEMDIDGFMDTFTDKLYESMTIAAEGVHN